MTNEEYKAHYDLMEKMRMWAITISVITSLLSLPMVLVSLTAYAFSEIPLVSGLGLGGLVIGSGIVGIDLSAIFFALWTIYYQKVLYENRAA